MKYAFAMTPIAALLLAMPALAQAPAANSSDPAAPANNAPAATAPASATNAPATNASAANAPATNSPAAGSTAVAPAAATYPAATEVEKYIGKDVYGTKGSKVGELNNLLTDSSGKVRAGIIEFGGFLGIGEHRVAVPWNDLKAQGDRLTVDMTDDQIKSAPAWNKDKPAGQFAEYKPYR